MSTMQACLDPQAGILSPSLEKNFLMAVALVASVSFFVSAGGDMSSIVDNADLDVATEASTTGTAALDAIVAGVAGFAQKIVQDQEEGNLVGVGADLVETGGIVELVKTAFEAMARFLAALL